MQTNDGKLIVIAGASRSGKTAYTKQRVDAVLPLLGGRAWAWDPEDQWAQLPGWKRVSTRKELLTLASTPGPMKIGFVAGGDLKEAFNFWAGCVQYAARYVAPMAAIAEELADVTSPGKAPGNWGILIRRGLKRGTWIFPISQRWAEADKTAIGNASEFVVFRQSSGDDVLYLSRKTRIPEEEIDALLPTLNPDGSVRIAPYVRIDKLTGEIDRNRLDFSKKVKKTSPPRSRKNP